MSDLAALGVTAKRRLLTEDGEETTAENVALTELVYTLPKSTEVQATFSHEGLGEKLLKIFKKEIQTGDGLFDQHVHIKTETTDATAVLLESTDLRAIVERVITSGGSIEIDGASVKVEIPGNHETDDEVMVHFVNVLLG